MVLIASASIMMLIGGRLPSFANFDTNMMKKKLITSALPYINGVKHLGNLVGSILPADIFARYSRQQGETVLFICGTDEHGAPAELGAAASGMSIEAYCQHNHQLQKDIYQAFNISFDHFGRTSSPANHRLTQRVFAAIDQHGFIFSDTLQQFYSVDDKRFLPDRYIEGTCPLCGFPDARGDQCDGCGALLNPSELRCPRSALSPGSALQLMESRHLFLDLAKLEPAVRSWLDSHPHWPATVRGIARKWLQEGLRPRCITRDLAWGIGVPKAGFEDKVFYVWFDAPLGYISMTQEWAAAQGRPECWRDWWQRPEEVELVQFMAKDNVPFHTVFWPAMMIATAETWTLPTFIKGVNWLTYEGDKFSTSRQRGVFTGEALTLFPADYWRYTLFCMMPETSDTDFSFSAMAQIINKDLADNLGNFINRLVTLIVSNFNGALPAGYSPDPALNQVLSQDVSEYEHHMRQLEYRKAGVAMRRMWTRGNEYITHQQPWRKVKTDPLASAQVLKNCLGLLWVYSCVLAPVAPGIAERIRAILPVDGARWPSAKAALQQDWLQPVLAITSPAETLIRKISEGEVEALTQRFAGKMLPPADL